MSSLVDAPLINRFSPWSGVAVDRRDPPSEKLDGVIDRHGECQSFTALQTPLCASS